MLPAGTIITCLRNHSHDGHHSSPHNGDGITGTGVGYSRYSLDSYDCSARTSLSRLCTVGAAAATAATTMYWYLARQTNFLLYYCRSSTHGTFELLEEAVPHGTNAHHQQ